MRGITGRFGRVVTMALAVLVATGAAGHAVGQQRARRTVPAGEVTGLEMAIEGALAAAPGARVTWLVTVYEVLRRRDLRPAPGVALSVTGAFSSGPALLRTRTDAEGHATLSVALPDDLEGATSVQVEAVSPRGIRRVFEASIQPSTRRRIELFLDRDVALAGGTVRAFGRVLDALDGRVLPAAEVVLEAGRGGAAVQTPRTLRTDAAGVFFGEIALPEAEGAVDVDARSEDARGRASVSVVAARAPGLAVRVRVARAIVGPGEAVEAFVQVLDADGAPVPDARIDWADAPRPAEEAQRTDADGRARLLWEIARGSIERAWEDRSRAVQVVHSVLGTASGPAAVRVVRQRAFVAWSVEGGTLAPGLPARVFARVTGADGLPRRGLPVSLAVAGGTAFPAATTDADGVAVFEGVRAARGEAEGGCGGPTSLEATLAFEQTQERLCLPIDPDATLAVRARPAGAGGRLQVEVERRADVAHAPVVVTALVSRDGGWAPIERALLGAGETGVTMGAELPVGATVWVRARPSLEAGQQARGGGTVVWTGAAPPRPALVMRGAQAGHVEALDDDTTQVVVGVGAAGRRALEGSLDARLGRLGAAAARDHVLEFAAAVRGGGGKGRSAVRCSCRNRLRRRSR